MIDDTERDKQLLAPENLPLNLDELGTVTEAELVMPGVYDAVLEQPEQGLAAEAYIVLKSSTELSTLAKKFGTAVPGHPGLLVYSEDEGGNTRYIVGYELLRYKILHQFPLPETDNIRSIASVGAELYPEYFGGCPVPFLTPWGCTTRNKVIANGVYWLETEQCRRGLAVAYPKYDDLSDGASGLAEPFDDGSARTNGGMPGYLFFRETDSCVPLFELAFWGHDGQAYSGINRTALMNAVYEFHPEYAAQHNMNEQAGLNDGMGLFLQILGNDVELESTPERLISLTDGAGTGFIDF